MKKTPRGIGLNLAFKLYILLVMIVGPTLLIYYIHTFRTIDDLHEREVGDLVQLLTNRCEDWIVMTQERPLTDEELLALKDNLGRDVERIVTRYPGVESMSVFQLGVTDLEGIARAPEGAPDRPTPQDVYAVAQQRIIEQPIQGGARLISVPLAPGGVVQGLIHLRVHPDKIGLGSRLPRLRANLALGGAAMLLVVGIGVALFFHVAVRRPIAELTSSMEDTAGGNLAAHVPSRTGEFGWLAASYNRMLRRLKASIDENRQLLEQIRRFNDELQEKIRAATEELAAKNVQLQEVNERLFTTQRQMTTLEKLATLGQVATIIAHELGTPLNAISGHLQLLLQGDSFDPKTVDRLKIIDGQVDRLTGIVRNVLRTMRVPPPKAGPVHFDEVIRREAQLIEPVARKRGVTVELNVPAGLPIITADPDQMEQVLLNLFSNAIDAMNAGGRLSVSARLANREEVDKVAPGVWVPLDDTEHLRIDVADTGEGMSAESIKRAFEPFFSNKSAEDRKETGMGVGLGLAICREIVRNHQGEIVIASEVGKGSTFTFYLPVDNDNILIHK
ncbi:MAG TPA: ATP-binding protein [Planctomycetota bacterium]|nr:ATP-binding protein [Planctomycetota bacterium]